MAERFICNVCELTEEKCECDRYCGLCMGAHQVRLCQDGDYTASSVAKRVTCRHRTEPLNHYRFLVLAKHLPQVSLISPTVA